MDHSLERSHHMLFSNDSELISLSDFSGDGLSDIVRIRNGECCYWPNLGYGRFGSKITLDNSPYFDYYDQFASKRILLADIDGSGTTDIIYLHRDGPRLYFNQSGNGLSDSRVLKAFPMTDSLISVTTADLHGDGTSCLVISSSQAADSRQPLRYLKLMKTKPHLMTRMINNLGASTEIKYATSTKFYLQDRRDGNPWITRLPFPVHVVESVVTQDEISKNRFVSQNKYHHGYYDGVDREFRGFGMIEQWDTEYIASLNVDGSFDFVNEDPVYRLPPVHTKKWFHLGVFIDSNRISRHYEQEYYYPDKSSAQWILPDTMLPPDIDVSELHDACRALKGSLLRAETYTDDAGINSPEEIITRSKIPHAVIETSFSLRLVQHKLTNEYAVFFPSQSESLSYNIDRNPSNPRIAHSLVLESNAFGQPLKELTISYGTQNPDPALQLDWDKTMQTQTKIAFHESKMTNAIDDNQKFPFSYRCPSVCESNSYELTGFEVEKPGYPFQLRFWISNNFEQIVNAQKILYESVPDLSVKQKRLLKSQRILFRKDNLSSLLPLYELESLAFGGESYKMAFTSSMLAIYLQRNGISLLPDPAGLLVGFDPNQGGYQLGQNLKASGLFPTNDVDGSYWIPSGQLFFSSDNDPAKELQYAKKNFCLPRRFRNPYNIKTYATFDIYNLLLLNSIDSVGNQVTVGDRDQSGKILNNGNDYRVLQPRLMTDVNRNRTEVRFDALGRVVAQAIMGKKEQITGDSVDSIVEDEDSNEVLAYLANPMQGSEKFLRNATSRVLYDLFSYMRTKKTGKPLPAITYTMKRVIHTSDAQSVAEIPIIRTFAYSDGFGRIIQSKAQFKSGPTPQRDSKGNIVLDDQGQPVMTDGKTDPRWGVDGWTIYNNKGKPVRKYDPFFSSLHDFEFGVQVGVSPVIFYDVVERVVATLLPNNTYTKEIFSPWKQISWDSGDTIHLDPRTDSDVSQYTAAYFRSRPNYKTWYSSRTSGDLGPDEKDTANKCAAFAGTPTTSYFDSMGRVFLVAAHQKVVCTGHELDGVDNFLFSRVELDIEGNKRIIRDASIQNGNNRGRIIEKHDYDMLGNTIHTFSSERGHSWILKNISGGPMKAWDGRGNIVRSEYDTAARPLRTFLQHTVPNNTAPLPEIMVSRLVYGESHPDAEARNIRNVVYMSLDQSGAATMDRLDFKGNTLETSHRLCNNYKDEIDWATADKIIPSSPNQALDLTKLEAELQPMLESETFHSSSTFDALNRPLTLVVPHSDSTPLTTIRTAYDVISLSTIDCNIRNEKSSDNSLKWTPFVTALDYDPKGQRRNIVYGNGVSTDYEYNNVSQLVNTMTRRNNDSLTDRLQNLHYTYDPLWNITKLTDSAKQTYFFRNQIVTPSSSYTYDSLYRLIEATGREHLGQTNGAPLPYSDSDSGRFDTLPGQENAMGLFQEFYVYDEVCNLKKMRHMSSDNSSRGWSRNYVYQETSHIESQEMSDRVTSTSVGSSSETYMYDAHGNMTRMPHLGGSAGQENIRWDFMDRMKDIDLGGGGTAYYTYNQSGQRVRKVIERGPNLVEERIYLGEIELYRKRNQNDLLLERETLHISDDHQRIAIVESRSGGSAANDPAPLRLIRYQLSDHLQSSAVELDDTARLLSYEEYSPYGSTTYQAKASNLETPKRYRYTGKERDEESGLSYHGARYMACWLGRWITNDPAGMSDGTNLYAYVRGNPIMMHDPSGLAGEGGTPPVRKGMTWRLSLDEIWPVGDTDPSITDAERLWRIISPDNKQFLWKFDNNMKDNTPPSSADIEPVPSEPVDIKTEPTRMMTKNWGGIKQAAALLRQAYEKTGPKRSGESWGAFKERFNEAVIGNIKKGRSVEATQFRNEFLAQGGVIQKGAELGLSAAEPPPNSPPAPRPATTPPPPPPAPPTPPATPEPTKPPSTEAVESAPTTESMGTGTEGGGGGAGEGGGGGGVGGKIGNALGSANTVFMAAGTAGSILRSIDQGHPEKAAATALVFTAVTFAAKKVPIVGYAMLAYGTYKNLDSKEAQEAAASARGFVGQYTDNKYVGMAVGGAAQLGEAAYKTAVTDTVHDIKDGIGVLRKWTGW